MKKNDYNINKIRQMIKDAEERLRQAKDLLKKAGGTEEETVPVYTSLNTEADHVIIGTFNGEHMLGEDGREYPVPPNYASKSKLVEGDQLKLTIQADGKFVYKQIGPIERKRVIGKVVKKDGQYFVRVDGKYYKVLLASITYFKVKAGDEVTIVVPHTGESMWGAIENVVTISPIEENVSEEDIEETLREIEENDDAAKKEKKGDDEQGEKDKEEPLW